MDLLSDDALGGGEAYGDMFHRLMKERGADFASGVPCGVLKDFILNFSADHEIMHIPGQNEPECVGIAAGAYLGGMSPVLYMQNSGMLKSTNEIGSLLVPCRLPILMLVSYRGCPGEDAAQHFVTGRITKPTLEGLGVHYIEIEADSIEQTISDCYEFMKKESLPSAILVRRDWLKGAEPRPGTKTEPQKDKLFEWMSSEDILRTAAEKIEERRKGEGMSREDAIDAIIGSCSREDAVISSTGLMSRSIYERHDDRNMFYNAGGFGLVSSIGLGFSAARPDVRTVAVDGDGSLLTNFGTLRTIGGYAPKNLVHVVLDNNSYGSCSEERSASADANIGLVAALQGYARVVEVDSTKELGDALALAGIEDGPVLIHAHTLLGGRRDFRRPKDLQEMAHRFRYYFSHPQ